MDPISDNNRKKFISINTFFDQTCDTPFDPECETYQHMGGHLTLERSDPHADDGDTARSDPDYERNANYGNQHGDGGKHGGGGRSRDEGVEVPRWPCSGWISPDQRAGSY